MNENTQEQWRLSFECNGYKPLIIQDENGREIINIEEFCEDDGGVPKELKEVYLLTNNSGIPCELIVVLNINNETDVRQLCIKWDDRILNFLDYGKVPQHEEKSKYLLKYNVIQLLLLDNNYVNSDVILMEEKSTDVSRKIFVRLENNEIVKSDISMLPFYFDKMIKRDVSQVEKNKLAEFLPQGNKLKWLYEVQTEEKQLSEEDVNNLKEWLANDNVKTD